MMDKGFVPWGIALGLSLGPAVSNGLARFAYGLVLPSMQADLSWTYTQAGFLNTANAAGYLAGALLTFSLIDRLGARTIFMLGIVLTPFALAGSAASDVLWVQSVFRIAAGIVGAGIFISGGAMAAMLFRDVPASNALAISLYFGGGGLGMILSGAAIPPTGQATRRGPLRGCCSPVWRRLLSGQPYGPDGHARNRPECR